MTGIDDFSGFEAIRAAMEVEKKGQRFYTLMSERAVSPLARELFAWLAQDEVGHLRTLEKLLPKYEKGAFWDAEEEFLPYLKRFSDSEIFPSEERLEALLKTPGADLQAFDLAIEAEERFSEYFRAACDHAADPEGKEAFNWLALEEGNHAAILRDRKERIKK